ncbi:hypothetical protein ACJJTC_009693 [Scirpophaga incertulas]
MALKCYKCDENLIGKDFIVCRQCQIPFHINCTSLNEKSFHLMFSEDSQNCLCEECQHNCEQRITIPIENSFQTLPDESDKSVVNNCHTFEFITQRRKKKPSSLPDLTASNVSIDSNVSSHSLPGGNYEDTLVLNELKTEICRLNRELEIANNEIENLNTINQKLVRQNQEQENIIKIYKSVSTDDLNLSKKSIRAYVSTPLSGKNIQAKKKRKRPSSAERKNDISVKNSSAVMTLTASTEHKLTSPSHVQQYKSDTVVDESRKMETFINSKAKVCMISSLNHTRKSKIFKQQLGDLHMCHYRMPGAGIDHLLNGLEIKLQSFTHSDYCVIMIGETDFEGTKNYNNLVLVIQLV